MNDKVVSFTGRYCISLAIKHAIDVNFFLPLPSDLLSTVDTAQGCMALWFEVLFSRHN